MNAECTNALELVNFIVDEKMGISENSVIGESIKAKKILTAEPFIITSYQGDGQRKIDGRKYIGTCAGSSYEIKDSPNDNGIKLLRINYSENIINILKKEIL